MAAKSARLSKQERRYMLGLALHTWENLMLLSLGVAALAAVFVIVSTYAVVQLQRKEATDAKSDLDRYKLTVEGQVADAKKEGIEAGKTAGNAMVRAASLEKQAQELRAANLELEARIRPRRISGEKSTEMSAILSQIPGIPIAIVSRIFDPEGKDFADDLDIVFKNAKWNPVRLLNWTRSDKGVFIATLAGTLLPPEIEKVLAAALGAADMEHKIITVSGSDVGTVSPNFEPNVLYLLIGARP